METVKSFINCLFCAPLSPRSQEDKNKIRIVMKGEREGNIQSGGLLSTTLGRKLFLAGLTFSSLHSSLLSKNDFLKTAYSFSTPKSICPHRDCYYALKLRNKGRIIINGF